MYIFYIENPGLYLAFLCTYFLHSRLLESPWHIVYVIFTISSKNWSDLLGIMVC